jgi:hypothetical protein
MSVNPLLARLAALSAWLFSLLVLVFVTGLLVMLMNPEVILGLPPWAEIFLTIPVGFAHFGSVHGGIRNTCLDAWLLGNRLEGAVQPCCPVRVAIYCFPDLLESTAAPNIIR